MNFMAVEDKKFGKRLAVEEHLSQFDQYNKLTLRVINGGDTVACAKHCSLRGGKRFPANQKGCDGHTLIP
ncbi:hypothetical protein L873DRAFT_1824397 [Choiromyces venosus 120613-1]|uniref:Uncharacterized protein n=1 Tax=Choiromyces venosus 120613-1 TaxID=1336337 RepID=A0A3N4IQS1_9PEZI|nr:hypothetical protein L873DRAFT_1824397 [Choiromyces venosus 120613-1]